MAVNCFVDTFNIGLGAVGSKVIRTGYGFQPKGFIAFTSGDTSSTDTTAGGHIQRMVGFAASATSEISITSWSQDAFAVSNSGSRNVSTKCITIDNGGSGGTLDGQASLDSFDSGGLTLNIDDQFTIDARITILAWGGSSITNVGIASFALNTITGDQDITGLGFNNPDVTFIVGNRNTTLDATGADSTFTFGIGTGQAGGSPVSIVWGGGSNDAAVTTTQTGSHCSSNSFYFLLNGTANGEGVRASYLGGITDGFRINIAATTGSAFRAFALCIKGGDWTIGESATKTDTTTDIVVTGLPSKQSGALIIGSGNTENTASSVSSHDRWIMGAWDSPTHRAAYGTFDENGLTTSETAKGVEHDEVYLNISTTDTINGLMDIKSVEATGETYIMDDADPSALYFGFLTWGPAPTTGIPFPAYQNSLSPFQPFGVL